MAIIYRTAGAWGAGKGANLTADEVDGNFNDLDTRLVEVETNPPAAIYPVEFEVTDGNQLYVHMSDYSILGPYTLPSGAWQYKGAWQSGYTYYVNDVITVAGLGTFLVVYQHVSDTTFDPFANDGAGHDYYKQMLDVPAVARWRGEWEAGEDYLQYDLFKVSLPLEVAGVYQVAVAHTADITFDPDAATLPSGGLPYYEFLFAFPTKRIEIAPNFFPPYGESAVLYEFIVSRGMILPAGAVESAARASAASDGEAVWYITKNNYPVGTITFDASTTGAISVPHDVEFESGDVLGFVTPEEQDPTLGRVAVNLVGTLI